MSVQKHRLWVLVSTHNLCFEQKPEKYQSFLSENFQFFFEVKLSIYLDRRVYVMFALFHHSVYDCICFTVMLHRWSWWPLCTPNACLWFGAASDLRMRFRANKIGLPPSPIFFYRLFRDVFSVIVLFCVGGFIYSVCFVVICSSSSSFSSLGGLYF